ncbi:ABC transporter substrate-binding protein [Deinococcus sp.]|uniref:ABC transporter substrate-binding protein n=1 Tax=Deinococcus sp. TaxID=47478 RepID=UPI003CC646C6
MLVSTLWVADDGAQTDAAGAGRRLAASVSGLALSEALRPVAGSRGLHSALSWACDLDSSENRRFVGAYRRSAGRPADALAALGYETGGWIGAALAAVGGQHAQTGVWLQALGSVRLDSPRGLVTVDARSGQASAPLYLRVSELRGGAHVHRAVAELPAPPPSHRALQALLETPRSGWSQPYLHA